jgi:DNA-binding response OmpR family regulator
MHSSSLLEKKKPESRHNFSHSDDAAPVADEKFVYLLVPGDSGLRVMRAPLHELLQIAQPVVDVPTARVDIHAHDSSLDPHGVHQALWGRALANDPFATLSHTRAASQAPARFGDIEIDAGARVVSRAGQAIPLAPLEFELLLALYRRRGAAAARHDLMREVWSGKKGVTTRTVDTHIFNLRRKLEKDPTEPEHILTVSKIGYRLRLVK